MSFIRWSFEALCINEFSGLTFTCYDAAPGACKQTGEDVLLSLSFDEHKTNYPVFGMGMCLLGFLSLAYFMLYINKATYTMLGHKGKQFDSASATAEQPSSAFHKNKSKPKLTDIESNVEMVKLES